MKYVTKVCEGYWEDEPERIFPVTIALGDWDEEEDWEDEQIFYYMSVFQKLFLLLGARGMPLS